MSSVEDMQLIIPVPGRVSRRGHGDSFTYNPTFNRCVPNGDTAGTNIPFTQQILQSLIFIHT